MPTKFTINGEINLHPDNYAAGALLAVLEELGVITITRMEVGETVVIP